MKKIAKAEYIKAVRRTQTALKRELKKSDAERDMALTEELIESLDYYTGELEALRAERGRVSFPAGLKRAAVVMLAFLVSFAAFATIAQAAGFRVWTAIIKHDAGYLRVDYVPDPTAAPTEYYAGWEDGEFNFFFGDELEARMAADGVEPLPVSWEDFDFAEGGVRRTRNEYYAVSTLTGKRGSIRIRMITKASPEPITVWGLSEDAPYKTVSVNGLEASYQIDPEDGSVFATWQKGGSVYCLSMYDCSADPEALLSFILGR